MGFAVEERSDGVVPSETAIQVVESRFIRLKQDEAPARSRIATRSLSVVLDPTRVLVRPKKVRHLRLGYLDSIPIELSPLPEVEKVPIVMAGALPLPSGFVELA